MENFETIQAESGGPVVTLWLSRPEVHNALNALMIREITRFFQAIEESAEIRIVLIRGRGKSFCSGADLRWMKDAFALSPDENVKESQELSHMFRSIFESTKIVIGAVHGNVFGGGNGLVAVCDIAYCLSDARFSLSETRIGMAAVSITPFLLQKMAAANLKELIFSAKTFGGEEAEKYGLINHSLPTQQSMDQQIEDLVEQILANGKQAIVTSKKLINNMDMKQMAGILEQVPVWLAQIRVSPEAREGFSAFLEKRKPVW